MKIRLLNIFFWIVFLQAFSQNNLQIVTGPYLQQVTDTEATVVWITNQDAVSWVELAPDDSTHFYQKERPKYYQTNNGKKVIGTVHNIRLKDLQPGTLYRYRIYSQEVLGVTASSVQYGRTVATRIHRSAPLEFTTLDANKDKFSFVVVNDIHEDNELLKSLLSDVKKEKYDMVFYNGDMANSMSKTTQLTEGFLNSSVDLFASETPFYMVRGNHEARGFYANTYMNYFPTNTGMPYYSFRHGEVCFIVLDSGEDKPDSDIEYGGLAFFDEYRKEQREWLKKEVKKKEFLSAKYKIVLVHIPPLSNHWHGALMVKKLFVPVLNEAGVDLMLSGHFHRHAFYEYGHDGCQFPLLVNSNNHKLVVDVTRKGLNIRTYNAQGKIEFQKELN